MSMAQPLYMASEQLYTACEQLMHDIGIWWERGGLHVAMSKASGEVKANPLPPRVKTIQNTVDMREHPNSSLKVFQLAYRND
jgi:hypothetical protein